MSVDETIKKLKEFYEKYKQWIIWGGIVLLISVVIIAATLSARRRSAEPLTLIETPLKYDVAHSLTVSNAKVNEYDFPEELEVFKLVSKNYHQAIDSFLTSLKRTGYNKTSIQTGLYLWAKGENYLEYVPDSQNFFFRFVDTVETDINLRVNSKESAESYLTQFYNKFFDRDYEFLNVQVETVGNRIRIEGNRNVNGYPLYIRGHTTYTDYLIIDLEGNLYEGNLLLVEHTSDGAEAIQLVDISNLQFAMSQADYPKEIFQVYGPSHDPDVEEDDGHPQGDTDIFEEEVPVATNSSLESVQLVYYFSDISFAQLAPTFRIESEGTIRVDNENVKVPLIIYTNALDPERVYVPSE